MKILEKQKISLIVKISDWLTGDFNLLSGVPCSNSPGIFGTGLDLTLFWLSFKKLSLRILKLLLLLNDDWATDWFSLLKVMISDPITSSGMTSSSGFSFFVVERVFTTFGNTFGSIFVFADFVGGFKAGPVTFFFPNAILSEWIWIA